MKKGTISLIILFVFTVGLTMLLAGCLKDAEYSPADPSISRVVGVTSTSESGGTSVNTGKLAIYDPLTNGKTVGTAAGGYFSSGGYTVTTHQGGYIVYQTGITNSIIIEFDARGYVPNEDADKMAIVQLFDCPVNGNWKEPAIYENYYIYEVRKRGLVEGQMHNVTNGVMLKCGGKSRHNFLELGSWTGACLAGHPLDWNPNVTYHWRIVYRSGFTEVYRNNQALFSVGTNPEFVPGGKLNVRIGGTPYGFAGPANVTYSNVRISTGS